MKSRTGSRANGIVFVNRYFYPDESATSQMLSDLSFGLARKGITVQIVCSRQLYGEAGADLPHLETIQGVTVRRVWTTRFGRGSLLGRSIDYVTFCVSSLLALLQVLRSGDTIVAKTDPPLISIVAMSAAAIKGARLINWLQDLFPEVATRLGANPLPDWLNGLLKKLRDRSLQYASMNVVLGERMRGALIATGVDSDNIAIVENWACTGPLGDGRQQGSGLRTKLNLDQAFIVGYSGNLGRAHEFDTLLGAAALLRDRRNIRFLMIGGGAGMAALKKAVLSEGLDNFRFLDHQPRSQLSDSLAAPDVHLVSLRPELEGLIVPSKFYGILAAGRPVVFVGDPDGELPRLIREFELGAAVAAGAPEELAAAIEKRARDATICEREGLRGMQLYAARYSAPRALELWRRILDEETGFRPLKPLSRAAVALPPSPLNR